MASLTLNRSWLNRLDSGAGISALSSVGKARTFTVDGEVSTWAGGRQRAMFTPGERGQMPVTLLILSASTVDTLRSWEGVPVIFRDTFGLSFVGVFFNVTPADRRGEPGVFNAEFTLMAVSTVDGV